MIGRLMGIDHGTRRIGLAISDALGISARELTILENDEHALQKLEALAKQEHIVAFVVGVPTNFEGSSEQADLVNAWILALKSTTPLPVIPWDEQLTSSDAKVLARQLRRKPDAPIDDLAARVMLKSYLDAVADGLASPPRDGSL